METARFETPQITKSYISDSPSMQNIDFSCKLHFGGSRGTLVAKRCITSYGIIHSSG